MARLPEAQEFLYKLIVAPSGVDAVLKAATGARLELDAMINGGRALSPVDRVDIYANMYFYRLLDVLKEDYPVTLAVLGPDHFHNLVTDYLIVHPPSNPSASFVGASLPAFLPNHEVSSKLPFLPDLACVERALIEVFHERDESTLNQQQLKHLKADRWGDIQLRPIAAHQLIRCQWKIAQAMLSLDQTGQWSSPDDGDSNVLIWRKRNQSFYRELDAAEALALTKIQSGTTFGDLCESFTDEVPADNVVGRVFSILQRWLEDELLSATI